MIKTRGNIWTYNADWIIITTNGFIKKNGEAVMGRGVAYQAKKKFPELPKMLGDYLKSKGNHVGVFESLKLITFPVKTNWWERASLRLIERSCIEVASLPYSDTFVIPKPGCGNGKLNWKDVEPICAEHLDNRFTILV